jgi:hypothetical protein
MSYHFPQRKVSFQVTPETWARLKQQADREGTSVAQFAKTRVLGNFIQPATAKIDQQFPEA